MNKKVFLESIISIYLSEKYIFRFIHLKNTFLAIQATFSPFCVTSNPNRFLMIILSFENLSSGENRAVDKCETLNKELCWTYLDGQRWLDDQKDQSWTWCTLAHHCHPGSTWDTLCGRKILEQLMAKRAFKGRFLVDLNRQVQMSLPVKTASRSSDDLSPKSLILTHFSSFCYKLIQS